MRELSYAQPQIWLAVVFVIITIAIVAAFVTIGLSARRDIDFKRVKAVGYGARTWWLISLGALLSVGLISSLFYLPYSAADDGGTAQAVTVSSGQYYWTVNPPSVPPGDVKVSVTSVDVNHGLGIYSPSGEMIGSVQAMPGYTNTVRVTLDEPGEYQLSCLEYCGVGHHLMQGTITVTGGKAS